MRSRSRPPPLARATMPSVTIPMNGQSTFSATSVCPRRPVCQIAAAASSSRTPASSAAKAGHRLKCCTAELRSARLAGTMRQTQLPNAARDATRFDYEAVRPVLSDARRERSRFVFGYEGKRGSRWKTVEGFADEVRTLPGRKAS